MMSAQVWNWEVGDHVAGSKHPNLLVTDCLHVGASLQPLQAEAPEWQVNMVFLFTTGCLGSGTSLVSPCPPQASRRGFMALLGTSLGWLGE